MLTCLLVLMALHIYLVCKYFVLTKLTSCSCVSKFTLCAGTDTTIETRETVHVEATELHQMSFHLYLFIICSLTVYFLRQSLSLAWNSPCVLVCLSPLPQFRDTSPTITTASFSVWVIGVKLSPHDVTDKHLRTELSPKP